MVAVVAALLLRGGRRQQPHGDAPSPGLKGTIGGGVAAAWRDPAVRAIVLLTTAFNFAFSGPITVGLAWLADNRFTGGAAAFGLVFSAWGAGAVVGAILGGSIHRVPRLGVVILTMAVLLGIGLSLIGLAPNVLVALAILGPMGLMGGFLNVQVIAWLQARVPDELRGRVMSIVMLGSVGLAPVSLAAAGALVDLGAVTITFMVAGVLAALAGLAWGVPAHMEAGGNGEP